MDATSNEDTVYADAFWRWNPTTKRYEEITGGGGGGMTTEQLNAAVAPKANTTDLMAGVALKANAANPTCTGEATAANLTVNGNISMTQAGASLTVKKIQAAPSSNLELAGIVTASGFVNLTGGSNIVNPDFSGTIA